MVQVIVYMPMIFARAWWTKPPAEMSRNRMEIGAQPIGSEGWYTPWMQAALQLMDQAIGIFRSASSQVQCG